MRHRRRAWAIGAAMFVGLGAAATTVPFHGHSALQGLIRWLAHGGARHTDAVLARRDDAPGRGTGGSAAGDAARASTTSPHDVDDGVILTILSDPITATRDDGSSLARATTPPGATDWAAASVTAVVGPDGLSATDPATAETVVASADGADRDGTAVIGAEPAATAALNAGASASPFGGTGSPGGGNFGFAPAGSGGTSAGAPDNGTPTGGTGGGGGGGGGGGTSGGGSGASGGTSGGGGGTPVSGGGTTGGGGASTGGGKTPGGGKTGGSGTAVPEPATWLLLVAGFGLVGAAQRRSEGRRRAGYSGLPANSASR